MNDEQLLQSLIDAARTEPPQLSFEQVASTFQASTSLSLVGLAKSWIVKMMEIKSIVTLSVGGIIVTTVFLILPPTDKTPNVVEADPVLPLDSITSEIPVIPEGTAPLTLETSSTETSPVQRRQIELPQTLELPAYQTDVLSVSQVIRILPEIPQPITTAKVENNVPPEESLLENNLVLKKTSNLTEVEAFVSKLESYGLELKFETDYATTGTELKTFTCRFRHRDGLKFKLTGEGFETLEISVFLNASDQLHGFSYRFNSEVFTRTIPLQCKGFKSHVYGEGYSGVSGRTNINISNQ